MYSRRTMANANERMSEKAKVQKDEYYSPTNCRFVIVVSICQSQSTHDLTVGHIKFIVLIKCVCVMTI